MMTSLITLIILDRVEVLRPIRHKMCHFGRGNVTHQTIN